jgi:uncharacterized RDD family membrane protein YckC
MSQLAVEEQGCASHPWRRAVSICHACGVELCEACEAFVEGISYCEECAKRPGEEALLRDVRILDPAEAEPAGFATRLLAAAIDGLILGCAFSVLSIAFWLFFGDPSIPFMPGDHPLARIVFWVLIGIGMPVYFIHSVAVNAQTPGMAAVDIAVMRDTGEAVDYRTSVLRYMAMIPSVVSIWGILWSIKDSKGRMLHDRLTHTRVVNMGLKG